MKRICCICRAHFGDKEPLEDTRETHGMCDPCLKVELEKIEAFHQEKSNPLENSETPDKR